MKKVLGIVMVLMMAIGLMVPVFASADDMKSPATGVLMSAVIDNMWVNCADGKTLNVREQPSKSSKVLYRVECGTKLNVIDGADSEWANVYADGKAVGYVMTKFLVKNKPGKYEITERDDNFVAVKNPYIVTARALNGKTDNSVGLRVKPNKTANAIRRLNAGDRLQVVAKGKTWSKVQDDLTGNTGYVANDYIARI